MATMAQLRYSPLAGDHSHTTGARRVSNFSPRFADNTFLNTNSVPSLKFRMLKPDSQTKSHIPLAAGGGGSGSIGIGRGSGGGGGWSSGGGGNSEESSSPFDGFGPIGAFLSGWRSRVAADPQFPFKVLMEELVGVSSCVIGDMASRPNFGLNELDFVFSTLVVGSIMNFVLMYLLAPTMSSATQTLPSIFTNSPTSHMFQPGPYSMLNRLGTVVYKGTLFACVGFAAGLVGTALSNGLIKMRKKMDPEFETPNKPPPPILNAVTWAIHMGVSSNLRYQTLNGAEFLLEKFPPVVFKSSVVVLRCLNNILGGMSFVLLARMTGSQSVDGGKGKSIEEDLSEVKQKLVSKADDLQEATSK